MFNPLDILTNDQKLKKMAELEKLAGFSPTTSENKFIDLADKIGKSKLDAAKDSAEKANEDKYWVIYKRFANAFEKYERPFALFLGDFLDVMLGGSLQTKIVKELIEEKINKMRKVREAAAIEEAVSKKHNVQRKRSPLAEVKIGGEKRLYLQHFIKRKYFLSALFLDSDEYTNYKKLVKQIEEACVEIVKEEVPANEDARKELLAQIIGQLKYEISQHDVLYIWKILAADEFNLLEWTYGECKTLNLLRPAFYEDLDIAYQNGKKMLKLLISDVKEEFPPDENKQDAYEDYLRDILEIYLYHHFVVKHLNQRVPKISLKEFETLKDDLTDKIGTLRSENDSLRAEIAKLNVEKDQFAAEARMLKNDNEKLIQQNEKLDPNEVRRKLQAAEAKVNAAKKELQETLLEEAELRSDMRELDKEVQELTEQLKKLNALPNEAANSVEGLLEGKRVVIFGGVGRDHYWNTLKEAGVKNEDYEWYEGYHTISLARTAEIVGRVDLAVVVTSYAGHLLLYQVRPCIKPHQHFFKIHNSGAGSLRAEILKTFKN